MAIAIPAGAQKKGKNKETPTPDLGEDIKSAMRAPDAQAIDQAIGEAMGYWQIGDVESLHKYYAEDVVLVSGAWEPPIIGWDNFLKAYQAQRAEVSGARMDRSNTLIKVNGRLGLGYLPIYLCRAKGWQSGAIPRAYDSFPGEAGGPVGNYTKPFLGRGLLDSRARRPDGFGPARGIARSS